MIRIDPPADATGAWLAGFIASRDGTGGNCPPEYTGPDKRLWCQGYNEHGRLSFEQNTQTVEPPAAAASPGNSGAEITMSKTKAAAEEAAPIDTENDEQTESALRFKAEELVANMSSTIADWFKAQTAPSSTTPARRHNAMAGSLSFHVPGPVIGKGRPRFARRGNFVSTFTPKATTSYEGVIKTFAHAALAGADLIEGPVRLFIDVTVDIPASWPAWKRAAALAGEIAPTTKPDFDNVLKLLCDALNGVVWKDDVQVVEAGFAKRYAPAPGMTVRISTIDKQAAQTARRIAA